ADEEADADAIVLVHLAALDVVLLEADRGLAHVLGEDLGRRRAALGGARQDVVTERFEALALRLGGGLGGGAVRAHSAPSLPAMVTVQRRWGPPASTLAGWPLPQ